MFCECNQQVTNVVFNINNQIMYTQVGTPETTRLFAAMYNGVVLCDREVKQPQKDEKTRFCQWLAGLIDGDGCFLVSKRGYTSLEITVGSKDEEMLNKIKRVYGGSVKPRSNVRAFRYR
jgi:ubiquinol-cytochrome c reductase cytochrome b subunit